MPETVTTLDPDILRALRQDLDPDEIGVLVATFCADLDRLVVALSAAASAEDAETFARQAHRLAGSAGAIGAHALHGAARRWSEPPEGADLSAAAATIALLAREANAALAPLHPDRR